MSEPLTMENLEKVLDKKFADNNAVLIEEIDAKFQRTDEKIDGLDKRVGGLEARVGGVETKIDRLDERVGGVETKIDRLDERVGGVETKIDRLDERVGKIEVDVAGLKYDVSEMKTEMNERFQKIEESLIRLTSTLDTFLKRLLNQEDEFVIMKAEMAQVKNILKEKLGIEVRV